MVEESSVVQLNKLGYKQYCPINPLSLRDDSMDGGGRTESGTKVERVGVRENIIISF
jgi:hypothetical protein